MWSRRSVAGAILLVVGACSVPNGSVTSAATTPTTTAVVTTSTTRPPDFAALCNGYLVLLRSGDPGALQQELEGAQLTDLETMLSSEGEFEAIAAAAVRLEEFVVARCAERFAVGVEPAPDNSTALTTFLSALAAGDQERGARVAWENVVAQFTWSSVAASEVVIEGDSATMAYGPTAVVTCEAADGVVVSCRFQES